MTGKFDIDLSEFRWVTSKYTGSRMLRCTLTWRFIADDKRVFGCAMEGCLFIRDAEGVVHFTTPYAAMGVRARKRLSIITPDLQKMLVDAIQKSKYVEQIGFSATKDVELPEVIGFDVDTSISTSEQ